jgi:hypothetical protein
VNNVIPLRALDSRAKGPAHTSSASAATDVTVKCPSEPPTLLPDAACALLRILRAVADSDTHRATGRERAA